MCNENDSILNEEKTEYVNLETIKEKYQYAQVLNLNNTNSVVAYPLNF